MADLGWRERMTSCYRATFLAVKDGARGLFMPPVTYQEPALLTRHPWLWMGIVSTVPGVPSFPPHYLGRM